MENAQGFVAFTQVKNPAVQLVGWPMADEALSSQFYSNYLLIHLPALSVIVSNSVCLSSSYRRSFKFHWILCFRNATSGLDSAVC